jgi:SAM-dependent methyltransferase
MSIRKTMKVLARILRGFIYFLYLPRLASMANAPDLFRNFHRLYRHPDLRRMPGGWLYKKAFYPDYLTVGGAGHAIFPEALKFCQGYGIDVGAGFWPLPGSIPVDPRHGPGIGKSVSDFEDGSLDYVFSSHCLEHIENWRESLNEWIGKLKPGGIVFIYSPHPDCAIWHPGSPFVKNAHKWIPTPEIIKKTLQEMGCEIIKYNDGPDGMQSFYVCSCKGSWQK